MNLYKYVAAGYCGLCGFLFITMSACNAQAQTTKVFSNNELDRQLIAQAVLLEGLDRKDISDWRFPPNKKRSLSRKDNPQELSDRPQSIRIDSDVNLRLQKSRKIWDSNGDDEDDAVVLDLYQE
jgi:hypothetical protein